MPLDLGRDLVVHWPAAPPAAAPLLRQIGARALLTAEAPAELRVACQAADLLLVADLTPAPDLAALGARIQAARAAGFSSAAVPATGDAAAFRTLVAASAGLVAFVYLTPAQIGWNVDPAPAVLRAGVWPGIASPSLGEASATESLWLDANTSLIAQLRALYPRRRAVLGYRPDKEGGVAEGRILNPSSVEVAVAEAFSAGGSVVLSLPPDFTRNLLAQQPGAMEAWKSLAAMRRFTLAQASAGDAPLTGRTAVLCGTIDESGEILNLFFRKNLCPVAVPAAAPPPLTPARFDVVVAANVALSPAVADLVAGFASAGGAVLTAPADEEKNPWWTRRGWDKLRTEDDRDVYRAGRGLVFAYHAPIFDPGAFALDLKDLAGLRSQPELGVKNYDLRIWSADSVLGVLHRLSPTSLAVILTAYGQTRRHDFLLSVRGSFRRATLISAARAAPEPLRIMAQQGRTELNLSLIGRSAVIKLEE